MKRVAVFSDTHGILANLPAALSRAGSLDAFLHLGDHYRDAEKIAALCPVPFYAVQGNCDYDSAKPRELVVTMENAPLLLVHGDAFYSTTQLVNLAERRHCKAALFGHSHVPQLAAQGPLLLINPGSLSLPRNNSRPSFAILTIEDGEINVQMISL